MQIYLDINLYNTTDSEVNHLIIINSIKNPLRTFC